MTKVEYSYLRGLNILFVEDDENKARIYERLFTRCGCTVNWFRSIWEAFRAYPTDGHWDLIDMVLIDHVLNHDEGLKGRWEDGTLTDEDEVEIRHYPDGKPIPTGYDFATHLAERFNPRLPAVMLTQETGQGLCERGMNEDVIFGFTDKVNKYSALTASRRAAALGQYRREAREVRERNAERALEKSLDQQMQRTYKDIQAFIGPSLMPVLILGESGVGKERIARAIHEASGLPKSNFRAINCGAFTDTLLQSQLFGHVVGAFTGADDNRLGVIMQAAGVQLESEKKGNPEKDYSSYVFSRCKLREGGTLTKVDMAKQIEERLKQRLSTVEPCTDEERDRIRSAIVQEFAELGLPEDGLVIGASSNANDLGQITGTLFLDEVAELSRDAQVALLRFLDGYGILPVGWVGDPFVPRVRIVAATNRKDFLFDASSNLNTELPVFREDLLWRLNYWPLLLPPLREQAASEIKAAAVKRASTFSKRGNSGLGSCSFEISGEALDRIVEEIRTSGDIHGEEKKNDAATLISRGNYRALNGMIDRACCIAVGNFNSTTEAKRYTITGAHIEEAVRSFKSLLDLGSNGNEAGVPLIATNTQAVIRAVGSGMNHLVDDSRDLSDLSANAEATKLDLKLVKAIRDLVSDSGVQHDPELQPEAIFWATTDAFGNRPKTRAGQIRWKCCVLLGMLEALNLTGHYDPANWNGINKLFGLGSRSRKNFAKIFVDDLAMEFGLALSAGQNARNARKIGLFLDLVREGAGRILDDAPDGSENAYYWLPDTSESAKTSTVASIKYLLALTSDLSLKDA